MSENTSRDKKKYRKTLIVNEKFQFKLISYFILISIISANITGGLVYLILKVDNNILYRLISSLFPIVKKGDILLPSILVSQIITILVVYFISILITHRIAGPIYRFIISSKSVAKYDVGFKIKLRENDEFIELADSMNNMIDNLNSKVVDLKDQFKELDKNYNNKKSISNNIKSIEKSLNEFQLKKEENGNIN